MAEHNNLYQRAVYYDVIFDRDVSREVDFIIAAYRHYTARELQSVLDLACGPGYHARAFARRGLRTTGLDLRAEMLALGQEKAMAEGVTVEWLQADMRHFRLERPVDMALCMFDGLDALLTDEDLVQHFQNVACNLISGGLYLIDQTHPRESTWDDYGAFHYSGERDGVSVTITWAINKPEFDLETGVIEVEVEMRVNDNGHRLVIRDSAAERLIDMPQIRLLAKLSGALQVVGWHGDFDLGQSLDNTPASRRLIAILQKREEKYQ